MAEPPHCQTWPVSVRTAVLCAAHVTSIATLPTIASTRVGTGVSAAPTPKPSWPWLDLPQVYTSPDAPTAAACASPAPIATTRTCDATRAARHLSSW